MFITNAFAETADAAPKTSGLTAVLLQLAPFLLIFAVFYFILILPQRRKQKAHRVLLSNLQVGNRVILNSGIVGRVVAIKDNDRIFITTAENTELEVLRSFVASVIKD